ncbi:hypothetical protein F5141DRAFT_1187666 [Pisolithus sp. B1]|nr:hypothetical protein F5141DRAFT_1187666 [Pisolithus sp. B1]
MAKPAIEHHTLDICYPPGDLPGSVERLLAGVLGAGVDVIQSYWVLLCHVVWQAEVVVPSASDIKQFNRYGEAEKIGKSVIMILQGVLTEPVTYQATWFTTSICFPPECFCRYHHNFSVHKNTNVRTYYCGVPSTIQVATHFFIDTPLLELFANAKVSGWLSSMNCAWIYNVALVHPNAYILNNRLAIAMTKETEDAGKSWSYVLNGFFIYSLLLDKAEKQSQLVLIHDTLYRERIDAALIEAYPHACDKCFVVLDNEQGQKVKIQAAVCDGIAIGHPCCAVHDCKKPLDNHQLQFCSDHHNLSNICAVEGCSLLCSPGSRTCHTTEHTKLEEAYYKPAKALAGFSVPSDSFTTEETEELIMRPCGTILAHATFYGSEAVSAVNQFAKAVFPTPQSTPEYFIFDNNCKLHAHQEANQDHHFSETAFPVDVYHFNSKHKETDLYCQAHCNPAAFPDLLENGKWCFNTSISILHNMTVHRYNFYLDEMIKRWN